MATVGACGGGPQSPNDRFMSALAAANYPPGLLANRSGALKVGRDMCGSQEKITEFGLMSQLNLTWAQVHALDTAAHKYLCKP